PSDSADEPDVISRWIETAQRACDLVNHATHAAAIVQGLAPDELERQLARSHGTDRMALVERGTDDMEPRLAISCRRLLCGDVLVNGDAPEVIAGLAELLPRGQWPALLMIEPRIRLPEWLPRAAATARRLVEKFPALPIAIAAEASFHEISDTRAKAL